MKIKFFQRSVLGTAIAVLCLMGVPSPINSPAQTPLDAPPPPSGTSTATGELPPNIYPTSPLAQVIRLTQAGVDESIILTFVTNSGSTFNLDSDKIIYLKDIGLPNGVVTAMMQRDQQLQQQMAAASQPVPPPAPPPETTTETEPAPPPAEQPAPPPTEITVNYFYDTLAPYGSWMTVAGYGRCWRPSVVVYNPGWQPYCDHGRWIYTDCGWYWYSDYSWGWAPFHYGRWFQDPRWGWCWTPDTIWGPSWVTWRYSSGYCGWAPLPPFATYQDGLGFFFRGSAVSIGFNWDLSEGCFTFVPTQFFCDPYPRRHCVAPAQVTQIFKQTTVINNFNVRDHNFVNRGIEPEHITAVTRTPIRPVAIRNAPALSGHGPRGDQLSRDGGTLTISPPPRTAFPAQIRPPQRDDNRSVTPVRPTGQPQVPVVTTRDPQEGGSVRVPPQRPSPAVNYNSSPTPDYGNRTSSPRGREQSQSPGSARGSQPDSEAPAFTPSSNPGPSGASEADRHHAPAAAPAPPQPEHSQPSSSPKSSGQNQNQNDSGNNSGSGSGNGPGNGSGSGPRH